MNRLILLRKGDHILLNDHWWSPQRGGCGETCTRFAKQLVLSFEWMITAAKQEMVASLRLNFRNGTLWQDGNGCWGAVKVGILLIRNSDDTPKRLIVYRSCLEEIQ